MRIKVKVAEKGRPFEIHYVDAEAEADVDTFLNGLVMKKLIHVHGMHKFTHNGYENNELRFQKLGELFSMERKIKLTSPAATLTLTVKGDAGGEVHHWLLDYSEFIRMARHYCDTAENADIELGTVFFIQHNHDKVFVRYSGRHLDFYYMDDDFKELTAEPDMKIHFKSREELTKEELKWTRSISFPDRLPRNPVPEEGTMKSQQDIDGAAVLLHRVMTIIGRFQRVGRPLEKSGTHFPSYVQAGEETAIGYVNLKQLQKLK